MDTVAQHGGRKLRSAIGLLLALLLTACQAGGSAPAAPAPFYNPLNSLMGADPWLQFHDGNYYLTATQWSDIRMWKSPTLAGLASVAPVTIWSDSDPSRCCNVWAPEFHLLEGPNGPRWYVYYTAGSDGTLDNQRMHVLESRGADPLGPYSYKGRIFDPTNDGWAIDGSVLQLDGRLYYLFSSWVGPDQSMFIAPMSDPWTISGPRALLSKPTHIWERMQGNVNEGPEVLQRDGRTFIIYSASACWAPTTSSACSPTPAATRSPARRGPSTPSRSSPAPTRIASTRRATTASSPRPTARRAGSSTTPTAAPATAAPASAPPASSHSPGTTTAPPTSASRWPSTAPSSRPPASAQGGSRRPRPSTTGS